MQKSFLRHTWRIDYEDQTGQLLALTYEGVPLTLGEAAIPFDIRMDGADQWDSYGGEFMGAKQEKEALTLCYALGQPFYPWPAPASLASRAGLTPPRTLAAWLRLWVDGEGQLLAQVTVEFCDRAQLASGVPHRLEGFLFKWLGCTLGEAEGCLLDMPGCLHIGRILPGRLPYEKAARMTFDRGSAPDGVPGVTVLSNPSLGMSASAWIQTANTCYQAMLLGDGENVNLCWLERYENDFVSASRHTSHLFVLRVGHEDVNQALRRYGRLLARVFPPCPAPAWVRDAVFMEVDTAYLGGFLGVEAQLDAWKEMGVNALYLLPIHTGGYAVSDHYDIDPALGTKEELVHMVETAHARGMRVLLDLLIVILTRKAPLLKSHPEYFIRDGWGRPLPHAAWGNVSTDYGEPGYQDYIAQFAAYGVREWGVDGYRVDAASYKIPTWYPGGGRAPWQTSLGALALLKKVREAVKREKPDAILLNEVCGVGFLPVCDLSHNFGVIYQLLDGEVKRSGYRAAQYKLHLMDMQSALPEGVLRVFYTRNHDTAWFYRFDGYTPEFFAYEAIHCLIQGLPLLFSGQSGRPEWAGPEQSQRAYYQKLLSIRASLPALRRGDCLYDAAQADCQQVFSCVRRSPGQTLLVLVNTGEQTQVRVRVDADYAQYGQWVDHFGSLGPASMQDGLLSLTLPDYGVAVLEALTACMEGTDG